MSKLLLSKENPRCNITTEDGYYIKIEKHEDGSVTLSRSLVQPHGNFKDKSLRLATGLYITYIRRSSNQRKYCNPVVLIRGKVNKSIKIGIIGVGLKAALDKAIERYSEIYPDSNIDEIVRPTLDDVNEYLKHKSIELEVDYVPITKE